MDLDRVIAILAETRELLASTANDFAWSSWRNQEAAWCEIDTLLRQLRGGSLPALSVLFAPTGLIQEVASSSGWGERFLDLAERLAHELSAQT